MSDKLFLGIGRHMIAIPRLFIPILSLIAKKIARRMETTLHQAMSKEHHAVHDFVAKEIPHIGAPITSEFISDKLHLPVDQVRKILRRLEHMILLDMNEQGAVTWAYPVTVVKTPHHAILSSGGQTYIP